MGEKDTNKDENEENEESTEKKEENPPNEKGGPRGKEPTRFGDWERNGRCYDF